MAALVILTARTRSWFGLVAHRLRYIIHIKFGLIQDMRVKEKWSPPNLYKPSNDTSQFLSKYLVGSKHTFGIEQHSPLFRDRMPGRRQCFVVLRQNAVPVLRPNSQVLLQIRLNSPLLDFCLVGNVSAGHTQESNGGP